MSRDFDGSAFPTSQQLHDCDRRRFTVLTSHSINHANSGQNLRPPGRTAGSMDSIYIVRPTRLASISSSEFGRKHTSPFFDLFEHSGARLSGQNWPTRERQTQPALVLVQAEVTTDWRDKQGRDGQDVRTTRDRDDGGKPV